MNKERFPLMIHNFAVVIGIRNSFEIPREFRGVASVFRFSFVFYPNDFVDWNDFMPSFQFIVENISNYLFAERISVMLPFYDIAVSSFQKYLMFCNALEQEDVEPPRKISFMRNDAIACILDIERWVDCGGYEPYYDSYTIACYFTDEKMSQFLSRISDQMLGRFFASKKTYKTEETNYSFLNRILWKLQLRKPKDNIVKLISQSDSIFHVEP